MQEPSEKYHQAIQKLLAELRKAEQENTKGELCKVEQHFLKANEILQSVLPLAYPQAESKD